MHQQDTSVLTSAEVIECCRLFGLFLSIAGEISGSCGARGLVSSMLGGALGGCICTHQH